MKSSRTIAIVAALVAVVVVGSLVATLDTSPPTPTSTTPVVVHHHHHPPPVVAMTTIVSPMGAIAGYDSPGGVRVTTVQATWLGSSITMPVVSRRDGYFKIRLPGRPNGSTTWVKSSDVLVSATPYRILVNLATTHLELLKLGKVVMDVPVGVGTDQYPTPTGNFFVAFYASAPDAGYGPFVLVTSAHSDTITDWEGSGDALVAIHGPLGADVTIGSSGAQVSHGCIRMHVTDQAKLQVVPVGTPISIVR